MARRLMRAVTDDTRTFRGKLRLGGPGAARKAARILSSALTWAVHEGQVERNLLRGALHIGSDAVRETVITEPEDYARLFAAMDAMVAEGRLRPIVRAFVVCAALTGARRGELQGLTWAQADLAERRIVLTDSKGGKLAKRGVKTEVMSLPPLAVAALAAIQPTDARPEDRVFPPTKGERLFVGGAWRRIRAAAGLPEALTLHGLRHSLGTAAALQGLSASEVQAVLRHRTIGTSQRYVHVAEMHRARLQDRVRAALIPGPRLKLVQSSNS
jgi:integrase